MHSMLADLAESRQGVEQQYSEAYEDMRVVLHVMAAASTQVAGFHAALPPDVRFDSALVDTYAGLQECFAQVK
jgi:hypothetical protein